MEYKLINNHTVKLSPTPAERTFIDRVIKLSANPSTTPNDLIALIYGPDNPILDHNGTVPCRSVVTAETLANPAYRVLFDILYRAELASAKVDPQSIADEHTLTIEEVAERLGVHYSTVVQQIARGKLGSWIKADGQHYVDPRALASLTLSTRGRKPAGQRASTDPLDVVSGALDGSMLRIKHPGEPLPKVATGKVFAGKIAPWRSVGLLVGSEGRARFLAIEPGDEANAIEEGPFAVRGKFRVTKDIGKSAEARKAFEAFEAK